MMPCRAGSARLHAPDLVAARLRGPDLVGRLVVDRRSPAGKSNGQAEARPGPRTFDAAVDDATLGISVADEGVLLRVSDDGRGLPSGMSADRLEQQGHMGLSGMRERIAALGGTVRIRGGGGTGALLEVLVPAESGEGSR